MLIIILTNLNVKFYIKFVKIVSIMFKYTYLTDSGSVGEDGVWQRIERTKKLI